MCDPTRAKVITQFRSLFCSLVFDPDLTLGQVTSTKWIADVVAQEVGKTCDRLFSPLVTLALFLGQVLSDDHSCRAVVARLLAWRAARGLPKCSPDTGAYCKARRRLPDSVLPRLVRESADRHETHQSPDWLFHGRRVVIVDGSTASMPDTPANQRAFPQHSNQKRGCGFPIARIVVLLSFVSISQKTPLADMRSPFVCRRSASGHSIFFSSYRTRLWRRYSTSATLWTLQRGLRTHARSRAC
jgi:hypothetical protein